MSDAIAGFRVVTANVTEQVAVVVRVCAWVDHAAESISHALAELFIRSWWEWSSHSSPAVASWARGCRVGWVVAVHLSASWVDLGELGFQIVEIRKSRDRVAVDRDET